MRFPGLLCLVVKRKKEKVNAGSVLASCLEDLLLTFDLLDEISATFSNFI